MPDLQCSRCKVLKDTSQFAARPRIKRGYEYNCRSCTYKINGPRTYNPVYYRNHRLRKEYGVEPEQFEAMLVAQDNKCAICKKEFDTTPHQDHDHEFGYSRGILCQGCNIGLGQFKDSKEALLAAVAYLEEWEV